MKTLNYLACAAAVSLALAGCGGGSGTSATPSVPGSSQNAPMSMKLTFNTSSSGTAVRHRNYVSQNTKGLGVFVKATGLGTFPNTTAAMRTPTWATAIAPGFSGQGATCTAVVGSTYSCTIILTAPVGYDDFQISTWDAAPTGQGYGASFASTANNLSFQNITNQLVIVNQTNAFNFVLDGVVKTVVLNLSPNSLVDGAATGSSTNPLTPQLQVRGIDADGNTIIGSDPWVDANGAPIAVNVGITANPATSPSPSPAGPAGTGHLNDAATPAVNDSCKALSANGGVQNPSQGSCVLTYNGGDLSSISLTATTTSSLVGSSQITNTTLAFTRTANGAFGVAGPPTITEYTTTYPSGVTPQLMARASDGNVWFSGIDTATGANDLVGKVTTGGVIKTYALGANVQPVGVASGPDQMLYVAESSSGKVDRIDPRASTSSLVKTQYSLLGNPSRIAVGPDNNMYVTEQSGGASTAYIAKLAYDGTVASETPISANPASAVAGLASGPNAHLWIVDGALKQIYEYNPVAATVANTYPFPGTAVAPRNIVVDANNNLWISDPGANRIYMMTPAGSFTTYPSTGTLSSSPYQLTVGPDGAIWAAAASPRALVRIDTSTGSVQQYTNFTAGTSPRGIAVGADGNLWFTEITGIGKLTP